LQNIGSEDLSNKVILEVGSGRGDTTRMLVSLVVGKPNVQLIVTDISDRFFQQLRAESQAKNVPVTFIRTGAHELREIQSNLVDFLVCNYTLCAVNSQAGSVMLALKRFAEVLKPGGKLSIEEEFTVSKQDTVMQGIWAEKWRILKSAMILAGKFPYNEIDPEVMASLCGLAGFEKVEWTQHTEIYRDLSALDFFDKRLDALLKEVSVESLYTGFSEAAANLRRRFIEVGGMEIPYYRLVAQKSLA
jgi:ubiquinone/menaquinone biosynthesis C-methylase UbiE